jgi:SagB-type dehydrogenase family enzyme
MKDLLNPAVLLYQDDVEAWLEWSSGQDSLELSLAMARELIDRDGHMKSLHEVKATLGAEFERHGIDPEILENPAAAARSGYHAATRDHPFLDMSRGQDARIDDAKIMAGFVEADEYPSVYLDFDYTDRFQLEDAAHIGIDEIRNDIRCQLSAIISGTFGVRRHQAPYFDPATGYHQVELLLKSVPSGGARHPLECFVEVVRSPSLAPGHYHYSARQNCLGQVALSAEPDFVTDSDADWILRLRMAPMVRRAMFRYRDPRSFRALLVDAGHADGQLEAISNFCNWRYSSSLVVDFEFAKNVFDLPANEAPVLVQGILEGWV